MSRWFAGLMFLIAGCSESTPIIGDIFTPKVVGNELSVNVSNTTTEAAALPLADTHCRSYGRVAKYNRVSHGQVWFDCVKLEKPDQ